MKTIKKACKGVSYPKSSNVSSRLGSPGKAKTGKLVPSSSSVSKRMSNLNKAKSGTSLGMKSVKAGYDKNPGVTRADIIVAAKKQAKKGMMVKKAQKGVTQTPVRKGASGPGITGLRKAVFNEAKSDWGEKPDTQWTYDQMKKWKSNVAKKPNYKKGGSMKKSMKTGGRMKKCAYGCK